MPIDLGNICKPVNVPSLDRCITMPGGLQVCAQWQGPTPPSTDALMKALFGQLNAALAPFQPIFNIIDTVVAIFDCVKAIATLNPKKILESIPALAEQVSKLLQLIPQMSLPLMIIDMVKAIAEYMRGLVETLQAQAAYLARINSAEALAAAGGNESLQGIVLCARDDQEKTFTFLNESAGPINSIIALLNVFLQIIGVPQKVPTMGNASPSNIDATIDVLNSVVEFLDILESLITVPSIPSNPADGGC